MLPASLTPLNDKYIPADIAAILRDPHATKEEHQRAEAVLMNARKIEGSLVPLVEEVAAVEPAKVERPPVEHDFVTLLVSRNTASQADFEAALRLACEMDDPSLSFEEKGIMVSVETKYMGSFIVYCANDKSAIFNDYQGLQIENLSGKKGKKRR